MRPMASPLPASSSVSTRRPRLTDGATLRLNCHKFKGAENTTRTGYAGWPCEADAPLPWGRDGQPSLEHERPRNSLANERAPGAAVAAILRLRAWICLPGQLSLLSKLPDDVEALFLVDDLFDRRNHVTRSNEEVCRLLPHPLVLDDRHLQGFLAVWIAALAQDVERVKFAALRKLFDPLVDLAKDGFVTGKPRVPIH